MCLKTVLKMSTQQTIEQELNELKSSLLHGIETPYSVPDNYFDSLAQNVLTSIQQDNPATELVEMAPLLHSLPRSMPFTVTDGYFEELPAKMLALVSIPEEAQQELETLSPILATLKKQTPYTIPDNYFDSLTEEKKEERATPVISMGKSRKWLRYAAAATVIAFVSFTAIFISNRNSSVEPATNSYAWIEKNTKKINATEIDEVLKLAGEVKSDTIPTDARELRDVSELVRTISDKEIQQFLNAITIDGDDDDDTLLFF